MVLCSMCNATLYAAVDAFRGFCVYAMLSLESLNATATAAAAVAASLDQTPLPVVPQCPRPFIFVHLK